jgi:RHS repeat-associated protein
MHTMLSSFVGGDMRFFLFFFCSVQLVATEVVREISAKDVWVEVHLNDDTDVSELVFSDASRVQYDYTDRRLSKITRFNALNEEMYAQTYEWDEGRLIHQTGWFTTQYDYDNENRVIAKLSPWYQSTIEYDAKGLATRVGDRIYSYDVLGQITDEQGYFHAAYDSKRNLIELNGSRIEVDEENQIIGLCYDAQGNLLKDGFVYDSKNQLIETGGERYEYDSLGRRIGKGNITYLYLGFEEIGSFENGRCKTLRIPGIGGSIAIEIDGKPYVPVIDAQGIVRKLIDPERNSVHREIDCDIFGGGLTDAIPYAYRGKRYDPETGLIYFGRRYYDPAQHRWLTKDPLGAIDHENLYQYIYNNPLCYWDPTGGSFWGYVAGLCEVAAGGAILASGVGLELVTWGGFTFGLGLTTSTGAALIGHGLAMTTYHAQDISFDSRSTGGSYVISKNDPGTPQSNENQNKQFNDAVQEIERKIGKKLSKDQRTKLHRDISGRDYGYHEIVEEGVGLFE